MKLNFSMKEVKLSCVSFICIVLGCLLTSCESKKEITITGTVTGDIPELITYSYPVNGNCDVLINEKINVSPEGSFSFSFYSPQTATTVVAIHGIGQKNLIVEPGDHYNWDIRLNGRDFSLVSTGPNERGNEVFTQYPNHFYADSLCKTFFSREDSSSVEQINVRVEERKQADLKTIRTLMDNKEITSSFMNKMEQERDAYYAALNAYIVGAKCQQMVMRNNPEAPEWKKALLNLYDTNSPNDPRFVSTSVWSNYASISVNSRLGLDESFNQSEMGKLRKEGKAHTYLLNAADKYLDKSLREYYRACYILFEAYQKNYEQELLTLFEDFKSTYPESKYIPFIEPEMKPIAEYQALIKQPFTEEMHLVENTEEIHSLKDAVKPYKGKKIYADIWATWCGPCKQQFKYNDPLKKLLKEKDMEMLYISIDNESLNQQWLDMIKFYKLEGHHIRAGKELEADLRRLYDKDGMIMIPWYILIDENGDIKELHTKQPVKWEELKEIL